MAELSFWKITGKDPERFLQGQLTVDVTRGIRCFCYCNAKARVCTLGWVSRIDDDWYLAVPELNAKSMFEAWKPYALFSSIQQKQMIDFGWEAAGELAIGPGLKSKTSWSEWAISQKIPIIGPETRWRYTPHMISANLLAVDYDKGCYLGQEIITRTEHLGKIKRQLITFRNLTIKNYIDQEVTDSNGNKSGEVIFVGQELSQAVVNIDNNYFIDGTELVLV